MEFENYFLIICAIGLIPIALSYGLVPNKTLPLLKVQTNTNVNHIFRAVMFLYFGTLGLWLAGAFIPSLTLTALICLSIFMLGLAFGRVVSIIVDGKPSLILLVYLVLEIVCGLIGLYLIIAHE